MPHTLRRLVPGLAAALLTAAPAVSRAQAAPLSRAQAVAKIDSLARAMVGPRLAGAAVAVVRGRDTLVLAGYGKADLEWDVPMTADAIFEIGSITKQFTAAAILQLAAEGKLKLDDDVTTYLPDYPTRGHRVTIRRLLDHTSGIRGYTEMPEFGTIAPRELPRDSLVAMFGKQPFDFAPGEALVYNNSAYFLLGLVIEKASGKSYAENVQERFFAPLGMSRSRYCDDRAVVPRRAHGYAATPAGLVRPQAMSHTWPYAAGSLCSTVGDMLRWQQGLHGGKVLSPAMYRELVTPDTLNDGTRVRYAKGLVVSQAGGRRAITHGGGIPGFLTDGRWYPDDSLTIVVFFNTAGPARPEALADSIALALLGPGAAIASKPAPANLAAVAGQWRGVGRGAPTTVTFTVRGDTLVAERGNAPPVPLVHRGDWVFESQSGVVFRFARPKGGAAPATVVMDARSAVTPLKRADGAR